MLVGKEDFEKVLSLLTYHTHFGVDTETTGLHWWRHRIFSVIIATAQDVYYFNFNSEYSADHLLPREWIKYLETPLNREGNTLFIANFKFDAHMLANEGIDLMRANWVCLQARERVIKTNHFPVTMYNLDNLGKRYVGYGKNEAVEEYISKHHLWEWQEIPGKKKEVKNLHFDRVPLEITHPYGEKDGRLHYDVGVKQWEKLQDMASLFPANGKYDSILAVDENERRLTKTCWRMERHGIKIDVDYTKKALLYEEGLIRLRQSEFKGLTGLDYQDSAKVFTQAFERLGLIYPRTAKGNPSFNAEVLEGIDNPVANLISDIRSMEKTCGTYYSSFLYFRDSKDMIHANIKQWGTDPARMSYSDPNLQNLSKENEEKKFYVRGCFIPENEEFCLVELDYKQAEFRLLLDYAGEHKLIRKILEGFDPHDATAQETGLCRDDAKTLNFALIYGMGTEKLARALKCSIKEAEERRAQYFAKMKNVERFIRAVQRVARTRKYVRTWLGRPCYIDDIDFSYAMLNRLIQGGVGEMAKVAMNQVDEALLPMRSKLLVQIHDSLLLQVHKSELDIVPALKEKMDTIYKPTNEMVIITDCNYSWERWAKKSMLKGFPCLKSSEQKTDESKISQSLTPTPFISQPT